MSDHESQDNISSSPQLLTPEDIELLKTVRPQMSPNGGRFIDLILKVFNHDDQPGTPNIAALLQDLGGNANPSMSLFYALNMLMNGPYKPK